MMEASTLADALLNDLDDLSDAEDAPKEKGKGSHEKSRGVDHFDPNNKEEPSTSSWAGDLSEEGDDGDDMADDDVLPRSSSSRFLSNPTLQNHLVIIRNRITDAADNEDSKMSSESQKEREAKDHQLVVQSNKHLSNLADELARAHGDLATAYKSKFPELEELLPNSFQYKNAIRTIWNETDLTKVSDELNKILNSNQIITITVAGSTTSGRPLTEEELLRVDRAATYMEQLLEVQRELVQFVENSMESLVPSICALVGSSTAARLLGLAGGLQELTKIPSCNLQVMGQVKHNSTSRAGLSSASTKQHVGILSDCDLVQKCPKPLQKKALKAVAAKLALAARFDFVNVDTGRPRNGLAGRQFRQELQEKFQKLQEPDKAPVLKALPK
jgi:U4/U6 small nuclear ribonucleoprotein PRP31